MVKKYKVDPALLVEEAVRMECIGRKGIEYHGKIRSSAEMRKLAGQPIFPLPPFSAYQYYMNKNGSSSSDSY